MKKMFRFIKPYWKHIAAAAVLILIATACDLMLPTIMSDILNFGIHNRDLSYVISCCLRMLGVALVGLIAVLLGLRFSTVAIASFCADLRDEVFKKVNRMTFAEFGELGTAALVTRATHDVDTVSWVISELSGSLVTIPVLFFGGVILSFRKDIALSLLMLAFVPAILLVVVLVGKKIVPLWARSDEFIDRQNHLVRQRLRGIRVIRAYNAEEREHENIAQATRIMAENIIKSNVSMGIITPVATFLLNLATILIVYFGGLRMEKGSGLSGADVFTIVQYISLVSSAVIMGAFSLIMFPHAKIAASRINQVLDTNGCIETENDNEHSFSGNIKFENVCFRYDGASEYALKDFSMDIHEGETVSIIGGTGSGKSTIVNLLLGFRAPTEGILSFDGVPIKCIGAHAVRDHISCVLQAPSIYTGSVMDNVKMGNANADENAVKEALIAAQAWEFVEEYADGLEHQLKQSGKNLSGGQKQRISIARALVKDAPIFIFDDSFSALDFLTEYKLRKALEKRLHGKTQLIITQRVATAMHTDRIYVLEKGSLVGVGDHNSLLDSCEIYRQIYASQTGGGTT